ncbi:MAG: prefoldin subunit beta [Candidatus Altiarchaeota archaeon]|nr:prefoldin subunit beta [Candidatus Altiarchaeota archaeon]
MDVPRQVQDKLAQFQNLQNQLQMVSIQRQQLTLGNTDISNAKKELDKVSDERVYRMVGPLLLETNKDEGLKYLEDESESATNKIKLLEGQERKLAEKLNQMRDELNAMIKPQNP